MVPVRQLIVVVLPAPLGPNKQNSLSFSMLNQDPCKNGTGKQINPTFKTILFITALLYNATMMAIFCQ
jgi:hypothetical protein